MIPDSGNADQFIRVFNRLVDRKLSRLRPRMATVDDTDGRGNPILRMWDEDDDEGRPPRVGRARTAGTSYKKGNRVVVHEVDGGDYVVLGRVVGGDDDGPDDEKSISANMLEDNAVDARALAPGAVTTMALASDLRIGASQIDFSVIGTEHLGADVRETLDTLRTAVGDLSSDTGGLPGQVGSLESRVAALESKVNALPQFSTFATVTALNSAVTSLTNTINDKIDKVRKDFKDADDDHNKRKH